MPGQGPGGPPGAETRREGPKRRGRRPTGSGGAAWRLWWEYNREHLIGLRRLLRERGAITGKPSGDTRDPLGARRPEVLEALRGAARKGDQATLRSAALIALGRMGTDDDAELFVKLLRDSRNPRDVHEGSAVGLGLLPPIENPQTKADVRAFLQEAARRPKRLPTRARGMVLLATGLRARSDPSLVMTLLAKATAAKYDAHDPADIAYACGLTRDAMVVPELLRAVRRSKLGERKLNAVARGHAVHALGLTGDPNAARLLSAVLISRNAQIDVRMSAALALARVLRETAPAQDGIDSAEKALLKTFQKGNHPVLRGFCAVALGGAREPLGVQVLMDAIDHGGAAGVKPFCAIALGLAARTLSDEDGRRIRNFLMVELDKTHELELGSALSIALGVAEARDAEKVLLKRLRKKSLPALARGAAAQGLGLMRSRSPITGNTLEELVRTEKRPEVLQDIVLALGLIGRHGVALSLVEMLPKIKSSQLQGRIMLALGHLDHAAAVEPLLQVLRDPRRATLAREFAAVALGMLGDRRAEDVMFALDAHFNLYSTTLATHEFMRLY